MIIEPTDIFADYDSKSTLYYYDSLKRVYDKLDMKTSFSQYLHNNNAKVLHLDDGTKVLNHTAYEAIVRSARLNLHSVWIKFCKSKGWITHSELVNDLPLWLSLRNYRIIKEDLNINPVAKSQSNTLWFKKEDLNRIVNEAIERGLKYDAKHPKKGRGNHTIYGVSNKKFAEVKNEVITLGDFAKEHKYNLEKLKDLLKSHEFSPAFKYGGRYYYYKESIDTALKLIFRKQVRNKLKKKNIYL